MLDVLQCMTGICLVCVCQIFINTVEFELNLSSVLFAFTRVFVDVQPDAADVLQGIIVPQPAAAQQQRKTCLVFGYFPAQQVILWLFQLLRYWLVPLQQTGCFYRTRSLAEHTLAYGKRAD